MSGNNQDGVGLLLQHYFKKGASTSGTVLESLDRRAGLQASSRRQLCLYVFKNNGTMDALGARVVADQQEMAMGWGIPQDPNLKK